MVILIYQMLPVYNIYIELNLNSLLLREVVEKDKINLLKSIQTLSKIKIKASSFEAWETSPLLLDTETPIKSSDIEKVIFGIHVSYIYSIIIDWNEN
jgi:hypothetical protein